MEESKVIMTKRYSRKLDIKHGRVEMAHGGGGRAAAQLVDEIFLRAFGNDTLAALGDAARLGPHGGNIVVTTDSHVVSPLFFPGGDIGSLAVHGTINDVAMSGAHPICLTAGFILEEGLLLTDLQRIAASMGKAAREAGVPIVAGDTKVVEKGKGDGCFITTTGIGIVRSGVSISGANAKPGDNIIVSGAIGEHGVAIMSLREGLKFDSAICSDSTALHGLVSTMLDAVPGIHALRDPTRGGVGTVLNEIAQQSKVGMLIRESDIPIKKGVRGACEFLGLDPLYVACEGRLVAFCADSDAPALLQAMRAHPHGRDAAIIGEVREDGECFVEMRTAFGGNRIVDWLTGEQLPRIC